MSKEIRNVISEINDVRVCIALYAIVDKLWPEPKVEGAKFKDDPSTPIWARLNLLSHRFPYDSSVAQMLVMASTIVKHAPGGEGPVKRPLPMGYWGRRMSMARDLVSKLRAVNFAELANDAEAQFERRDIELADLRSKLSEARQTADDLERTVDDLRRGAKLDPKFKELLTENDNLNRKIKDLQAFIDNSQASLESAHRARDTALDEAADTRRSLANVVEANAHVNRMLETIKASRPATPTHICVLCHAGWIELPDARGWTLWSTTCGPCCDNPPKDLWERVIKPIRASERI